MVIFLLLPVPSYSKKNDPKHYCGEAVLTTAHLINRLPSPVLGFKNPMQVFSQFFPNFNTSNNLTPRIFGCVLFVHIHDHNKGKLDPCALKCIFIGYSSTQKGYKCYHPLIRKFFVSANVAFVERETQSAFDSYSRKCFYHV